LRGCHGSVQVVQRLIHTFRAAHSMSNQRLNAGPANGHQGKLGSHEKGIQKYKQRHHENRE
jgi:hypothetical protein